MGSRVKNEGGRVVDWRDQSAVGVLHAASVDRLRVETFGLSNHDVSSKQRLDIANYQLLFKGSQEPRRMELLACRKYD